MQHDHVMRQTWMVDSSVLRRGGRVEGGVKLSKVVVLKEGECVCVCVGGVGAVLGAKRKHCSSPGGGPVAARRGGPHLSAASGGGSHAEAP